MPGPHQPPDPPHPVTPDGRYFVVRGRLWRRTNPHLSAATKDKLVHHLMTMRSRKGRAMRANDAAAREAARREIDATKIALGERGPAWWTDGARDFNRTLAKNSPYAEWFARLE